MSDEEIDALDYWGFETFTDEAIALEFEGDPVHEENFSDSEWELTHQFQKVVLW